MLSFVIGVCRSHFLGAQAVTVGLRDFFGWCKCRLAQLLFQAFDLTNGPTEISSKLRWNWTGSSFISTLRSKICTQNLASSRSSSWSGQNNRRPTYLYNSVHISQFQLSAQMNMEFMELRLFPHRGTTSGAVCGVAAPKVTVSLTHQAARIPLATENLRNPIDCKNMCTPEN